MTALLHPGETLHVGVNVIVRPGDPAQPESLPDDYDVLGLFVAPQDWVALTDTTPNAVLHDVRTIVPLYRECSMEWQPGWKCDGWIPDSDGDRCGKCDRCEDGRVLVGRGSIEVVPVYASNDENDHSRGHPHVCVIDANGIKLVAYYDAEGFMLDREISGDPIAGQWWGIVINCVEVAP